MAESFPLQWPDGWARTLPYRRNRARYTEAMTELNAAREQAKGHYG